MRRLDLWGLKQTHTCLSCLHVPTPNTSSRTQYPQYQLSWCTGSCTKDSPLTCTPNSGFRTIQIKVNTCKWVLSTKLQPFGHKRPFLLHPAQQDTAPAPIPQPRAPLHRCSMRRGTRAHLAANPPAPPKSCAKCPHESSGGQSLPADGVKAHNPSRNSSTLLFLSVKMHVFFSASLQAWLSQKFKVCGDRSSLQQCCVCLRCCALGGPTELFSFWVEHSLTHCWNADSKHVKLTFISTPS